MIVPFLISIGTSYFLWITYLQEMVTFPTLMLFLGVAMSITAFPVLARILGELHLFSTAVGIQAISAAAIDDAAAWALLALVIGIISASTPLNALYIVLLAIGFALIMLLGVRRLLSWLFYRGMNADGSISQWIIFVVFMIILAAALTTEIIGIHAIFGGFLAGLAIPRGRGFELMLTEKLEDFVTVLFLPLVGGSGWFDYTIGTETFSSDTSSLPRPALKLTLDCLMTQLHGVPSFWLS